MSKSKMHSQITRIGGSTQPGFFYRLVSSQRFLAMIGLIFLVAIMFPLARTYSQRLLVEKEIKDVEQQISESEKKNQELRDLVLYLQSEQSLEEQARLNLNLKKPGEAVIVIDNKKNQASDLNDSATNDISSNLLKWWRYFFK
ncbi:MAG: septum formation initiator family protein [Patescibacteria group bacterium]